MVGLAAGKEPGEEPLADSDELVSSESSELRILLESRIT